MQHYVELDTELGREAEADEDRCSEEHPGFDLQCTDSLAIAANRIIGEDILGAKRLLHHLRILFCRS